MAEQSLISRSLSHIEKLKAAYAERLESEFKRIETLSSRLKRHPSCDNALSELHSALHTLAGAAGTFGFHSLGEKARELETIVAKKLSESSDEVAVPVRWLSELREAHAADRHGQSEEAIETSPQAIAADSPCLWLVERDHLLASYALSQLTSFGFRVYHLDDADALKITDNPEPDLLLIDHHAVQCEESEAQDFWQSLLDGFQCPIFFTGAEDSFSAKLEALRAGALGYFVKPLDMTKLASHISQVIRTEDSKPGRVLIIEDDRELASYCKSILEEKGMQVAVLEKTEQLFETVSEFNPELVLMDLWLPHVTGAELAALLSQTARWAHLPIIYLSAESNRELRNQALLRGGDAFLEKPVDMDLLVRLCAARIRRLRELERTRNRDGLTGLLKHASIKEAVQMQWQLAQRRPQTFSVVMLDIDHFKAVNDTYGHAVGDTVIAAVGTLLRQHCRTTDKLGRYGGEEFTLVLPDCNADHAHKLVNRLREDFAGIKFASDGESFTCTLSAGVADNHQFPKDTAEALLEKADQALYRAKRDGRNRVVRASDQQV
ncbi:diguanylate cyclase [Salinivibrio sp. MA427]|uniref:diguanylate cyclase n=1 Tax=Salinivibrio sp. MA427 TaxID=1909455 RepID=UPI00098A6D19|nr:diguanylate cyclase [Salinivibrio sp. MA427]OOF13948.1 diguanylate cyclase [Salinivibrio sp. MA427]